MLAKKQESGQGEGQGLRGRAKTPWKQLEGEHRLMGGSTHRVMFKARGPREREENEGKAIGSLS